MYSSKEVDDIEAYDGIIRQQLSKGYIEEADSSDEYKNNKDVVLHYLPHHMVKSAEKMRIVYEGCAKSHQSHRSLNECLYRGKNCWKIRFPYLWPDFLVIFWHRLSSVIGEIGK